MFIVRKNGLWVYSVLFWIHEEKFQHCVCLGVSSFLPSLNKKYPLIVMSANM